MVRNAPVTSALMLIAASSVVTLSGAALEYNVRVRNLTYLQPFSPIVLLAHTREIYAFQEDEEASAALRQLAETGDVSSLMSLAEDESIIPYLCGYAIGPDVLMPGDTERLTLMVDDDKCGEDALFSMASMLVNTNDAFVGIDSESLKQHGSSKVYPPAFDAGTEVNNELCSYIPGPACDAESGNDEDVRGEGYVHIHRGLHGVGDLSSADYDWKNPVAEVYIAKPTSV